MRNHVKQFEEVHKFSTSVVYQSNSIDAVEPQPLDMYKAKQVMKSMKGLQANTKEVTVKTPKVQLGRGGPQQQTKMVKVCGAVRSKITSRPRKICIRTA